MLHAAIRAIEYDLPSREVTTEDLAAEFPEWSAEKIAKKTGINTRHVAGSAEYASDLAVRAATRLFASGACSASEIDFVLLCTQSPDLIAPTTACLIQDRLKISTHAGAVDFNLGCSGFVYGLGLAEGLVASGQARAVLLLTAETYSKYLHPSDKGARTIFGDGAAATLLRATETSCPLLGPFEYGTDGRGGDALFIASGGPLQRHPRTGAALSQLSGPQLYMDGARVFGLAVETVPRCVRDLLSKARLGVADLDLVIFHQANEYLLRELQRELKIPTKKLQITISDCANTVSSTIPIAMRRAASDVPLEDGDLVLVVGFGVGFSWAATLVRWHQFYQSPSRS